MLSYGAVSPLTFDLWPRTLLPFSNQYSPNQSFLINNQLLIKFIPLLSFFFLIGEQFNRRRLLIDSIQVNPIDCHQRSGLNWRHFVKRGNVVALEPFHSLGSATSLKSVVFSVPSRLDWPVSRHHLGGTWQRCQRGFIAMKPRFGFDFHRHWFDWRWFHAAIDRLTLGSAALNNNQRLHN